MILSCYDFIETFFQVVWYDFQCDGLYILIIIFHVKLEYS